MKSRSHWVIVIAFFAWLALGSIASLIWIQFALYGAQKDFQNHGQAIEQTITQRLQQNEAVLNGLEALLTALNSLDIDALHRYANKMLVRYPHLYTIGYQPRVPFNELTKFEQEQRQLISPGFYVKSVDLTGIRKFVPVAPRPFYYPVVFMEPNLKDAQDVYGLDLYQEPVFRENIDKSVGNQGMVSSKPFTLIEGGRGYIFLKTITKMEGRPDLVTLLIRADKLLTQPQLNLKRYKVTLQHLDYLRTGATESGNIFTKQAGAQPKWASYFLPEYRYSTDLHISGQPFRLLLTYQTGPEIFSFMPLMVIWFGISVLCLFSGLWYTKLLKARAAHKIALEEIRLERVRGQTTRFITFDEMASGIAHELNQPLGAILSYNQACVRILQEEEPDIQIVIEAMQKAANETYRAGKIIQRLRSLANRNAPELTKTSVEDVINRVLARANETPERKVPIKITCDTSLPRARADSLQLEQVIENLLRNAIDAVKTLSDDSGHVELRAYGMNNLAIVDVIDNGPGVSPILLPKLFHPFVTSKEDGMGLGLALSQTIIESFGGRLEYVERDDSGAIFRISLPTEQYNAA